MKKRKLNVIASILVSGMLTASITVADTQSVAVKLDAIRNLMDAAANGTNTNVTYILFGDSTRDSDKAGQEFIYGKHLAQVNVKYVHNARSGLQAYQWIRNTVPAASLQKAIDNTEGEGENTIMEFSLGINDFNAFGEAKTKTNIIESLEAYITAKPKAHIVLIVPVSHNTAFQKKWPVLYTQIAEQFDLPLLNKERVLYSAFNDQYDRYYYDGTHPCFFGAMRLTRYILESISGPVAKSKMSWQNDFFAGSKNEDASVNLAENKTIYTNSWYWPHNKSATIPGGSRQSHPSFRAIEPIAINGNSLIKLSGVTAYGISMIDSSDKLIYTFHPTTWKNHDIVYFYLPAETAKIKVTLSSAGSPAITYLNTGELAALTAKDIYYKKKTVGR